MPPRVHVFVCDNRRPEGGRPACGTRGDDVALALTEAILSHGAGGQVAVTRCGCLGRCFDGPTAVEYPAGRWWIDLTPAAAGELAALVAGDPTAAVPASLQAHLVTDDD